MITVAETTLPQSLSGLVEAAEKRFGAQSTLLSEARIHLEHLTAQISEFLAHEGHAPGRNPGIFLCRLSVHLRGLANELDGGGL